MIRIRQALGELGVVGKNEQTAGVEIETAYRGYERVDVFDQVINRGAAFGIFEGRDVAGGLVEKDVDGALRLQRLVVEEDLVAVEVDPLVGVFDYAAIDLDAAGMDPTAGLRAGA